MHFLITNDDGIHAPGLAALEQAVKQIPGAVVTVVAPNCEQSQCGHRVTTREPLAVAKVAEGRFAVAGTPADCVRVSVFGLGIKPDLVVSGVNAGGNMGQDLVISGTVAAAREAAFHGIPAIAFSHYLIRDLAVDWGRVTEWTSALLAELPVESLADGEFWNVNFPHLPPGRPEMPARVRCHACRAPLNVSFDAVPSSNGATHYHYNATYASRPAEPGSDVAVCFAGAIAVMKGRV